MKLCFIILSLFASAQLVAQTLQVKVVDSKGESLPYASVYINQTPSSYTDLNGISLIPSNKIKYGDTITSTYIGMNKAYKIVNKEVMNLQLCTIVLNDDKVYELDPVVVKAYNNDGLKLFRKDVITHNSLIFTPCIIKGKFKAEVTFLQEKTPSNVEGTFLLNNDNPRKIPLDNFFQYYISETPLLTTTEENHDVLRRTISAIRNALSLFCKTVSRINWEHKNSTKHSKISYLGLNNNHHYFRLVYVDNIKHQSFSFQSLFSVNKDTQEIETVESFTILSANSSSTKRDNIFSASCQNIAFKKEGKELVITVPSKIEYNWSNHISLSLSDITIDIVNK